METEKKVSFYKYQLFSIARALFNACLLPVSGKFMIFATNLQDP